MKKNQVKDLLKIVGVTALTLTLSASTFLCVNNLAFAAATKPEQLAPVSAPVGPDTKAADNAIKSDYKKPNIKIICNNPLDENGKPYPLHSPGADALSPEEAAQIGAQYIWDMEGKSIDGKVVEMLYEARPFNSRSYWLGTVVNSEENLVGSEIKILHSFTIDAVTGDMIAIYANPNIHVPDLCEGKIVTITPVQLEAMQFEAPPEVEEYAEFAREYAQKHFNHSKVTSVEFTWLGVHKKDGDYVKAYKAGKDTLYPFTIYEKGRTITFNVTDDTGRVATIAIYMDTNQVIDLDTTDSGFIPGYNFETTNT